MMHYIGAMIKLDILSDPICPWCYIGKTNLDRALEAHPEHQFLIEWHPFQLNPDMPAEGMERRVYLEMLFGDKEATVKAHVPLLRMAEDAGLHMNFEAITRTPNTIDAHRLIHWAGIEGKQNAVVDRLFKAYFKEGCDISDHSVLKRIAAGAGLDGGAIARLLATDADADNIRERDAHARHRGVQGVPCFIIDNRYVVTGAQTREVWENVIRELAERAEQEQA